MNSKDFEIDGSLRAMPVEIIIKSTKAIIFEGYITEDLTLTNDTEWIFQNSMVISSGAKLTINAGTTIKMLENTKIIVDSDSYIFSNGTKENPVTITSYSNYWRGISIEGNDRPGINWENPTSAYEIYRAQFNFTIFKNFGNATSGSYYFSGPAIYTNCDFRDFSGGLGSFWVWGVFDKSNLRYGVNVNEHFFKNSRFSRPSGHGIYSRNMNITSIDYWGNINATKDTDPLRYNGVYEFENLSGYNTFIVKLQF